MADRFSLISGNFFKDKECTLSEEVRIELAKLNVNSYLFREYMLSLEEFLEEDSEGYLMFTEGEIANIWKCLTALAASKKQLLKSSISLELH